MLDTVTGVGAPAHPVPAKHALSVQIAGRVGVPTSGVGEVAVNVTVSRAAQAGTLVVAPSSKSQSGVTALDFGIHESVSNVVVAKLDSHGTLSMGNHSAGTIAIDVDVLGYYRAGRPSWPGSFAGLTPAPVLDSRTGRGVAAGRVHSHRTVSLRVLGRGGVPDSAVSAVLLNVGVARPDRSGSIVVYAHNEDRPDASDLHFHAGDPRRELVYAPVGIDGKVALYNQSAGSIDLHADVTGYVRAAAGL
ncbi:MAG TPA: hypothetical protein VGJ28_07275, partial [Micromonosporaceae bacterium]